MTDFTFTRSCARAQEGTLPERTATHGSPASVPTTGSPGRLRRSPESSPRAMCRREWGLEFTGTLALMALVGPEPEMRGPRWSARRSAAVVALLAHGLPFKLGPVLRRDRRHHRGHADGLPRVRRSAGRPVRSRASHWRW